MSDANEGEVAAQDDVQTQEGQTTEVETNNQSGSVERISALEAQIAQLNSSIQSQFGQITEALKPKQRVLSAEEKALLLQQNPAAAIESIVAEKLSTQTDVLKREMDKKHWDARVESEFPVKDPAFMQELKGQWEGLISSGLDPTNPRAVYKAAEAAAMVRGLKKGSNGAQQKQFLSAESGSETRAFKPKSSIPDSDPKVRFYAMLEKDPKKVAEFKKKLEGSKR